MNFLIFDLIKSSSELKPAERDVKGLQVKVTGEGGALKRRQASKNSPKGTSSHLYPETCTEILWGQARMALT